MRGWYVMTSKIENGNVNVKDERVNLPMYVRIGRKSMKNVRIERSERMSSIRRVHGGGSALAFPNPNKEKKGYAEEWRGYNVDRGFDINVSVDGQKW